ncbi:tRNA lysidine(34) synthetase TilS [Sphingomonas sp.]|uniref:tRNA lysidine(34) synthetase TilS n=1 Tax=Sphingomonas sp. TaxID=28214 RepID=UPI003CC59C67
MPGAALIEVPVGPEAVERFRADLERLTGGSPQPDAALGIAVSGGSDSLALLLLARAAWPGLVAAATVDHGLRDEAAAEARYVGEICAGLGIPHATLRLPEPRPAIANVQERARVIRYRCLASWAQSQRIAFVATAHQRDDVAESFLMRAVRGAGVRSLASMPDTRLLDNAAALLVRPLLGWTRAELGAIVKVAGLDPVADPSNADPRFDRARMRTLLAENPKLPPEQLARAATNLRDVEEAIEWMVLRDLDRLEQRSDGTVLLNADGLPFELKRRFILRAIETVRRRQGLLDPWRATAVADLGRSLDRGSGGTVADVEARVRGDRWHFRPAPPRRRTATKG